MLKMTLQQSAAKSAATCAANTARDNYLSGNSITY